MEPIEGGVRETSDTLATIEDDPHFTDRIRRNLVLSGWEEGDARGDRSESVTECVSVRETMERLLRLLAGRIGAKVLFAGFGAEQEGLRFVWGEGLPSGRPLLEWARRESPRLEESFREGKDFLGEVALPGAGAEPEAKILLTAVPIYARGKRFGILAAGKDPREPIGPGETSQLRGAAFVLGETAAETWEKDRAQEILYSMVQSLVAALDARDPYTGGHSDRVAIYSMAIANELNLAQKSDNPHGFRDCLRLGALLHDVGKVGVPDQILLKPSQLTPEERKTVEGHTIAGAEIIGSSSHLSYILPGILYHHERQNGSGYPLGLTGDRIPLVAKIIGVADVYDALTSARPYRPALSQEEAIGKIREGSGTLFDSEIVEALDSAYKKQTLTALRCVPSKPKLYPEFELTSIDKTCPSLADQIPSLPIVMQKVTLMTQDEGCSIAEIAKVLSSDHGLVVRILKLANSAFYALPGRVGTIPTAITLLGLYTLRNIVIGTAMADLSRSLLDSPEEVQALWDHGLQVGIWSRTIARRARNVDPEEAFTAGLLHDFGKALVLKELPQNQAHLRGRFLGSRDSRLMEREVIGFDHTQLGAWAMTRWRLPESLIEVVRYHHDPRSARGLDPSIEKLVWTVHASDAIADGDESDPAVLRMHAFRCTDPLVSHHLPIKDDNFLEGLLPQVREQLGIARRLFPGPNRAG